MYNRKKNTCSKRVLLFVLIKSNETNRFQNIISITLFRTTYVLSEYYYC